MTPTPDELFWSRQDSTAGGPVLHVGGAIDSYTIGEFTEQLRSAEATITPPDPVLLDLTGVNFFGSAALAALVLYSQRCTELGSRLLIITNQHTVLRTIALTGMAEELEVVPTLEQARET